MGLKIVYIHPPLRTKSWKSRILYFIRGRNTYFNQEGFFVESLKKKSNLRIFNLHEFLKEKPKCDFIIMDSKSTPDGRGKDWEFHLRFLKSINSVKKGLFVSNDRVEAIPANEVLDVFDIIFKREPWKDLNWYNLSEANRKKISSTMLPCPLVLPSQLNKLKFKNYFNKQFDVFFNGQATNAERIAVWSRLKEENSLKLIGGLQPTWINVSPEYQFKKLNRKKYKRLIHQSKINLAIEGIGTFTYRHLELLSQGAFMMSHSNIKEQNLPIEIVDGEHFVSYENVDDLIEKIGYYLERPEERLRIAKNGFERFKRDYSFEKHGKYIMDQILNNT